MNSTICVISSFGGNSFAIASNRLARVVLRAVDHAKRFLDPFDRFRGETFALQADEIDAANLRGISVRDHEGRHVLHDFRATAGDREPPDPAELMDRGQSTHDRVVADLHMAGERSVVRKNDFIADGAIVPDVAVGEKISAVADACFSFARSCCD